MAAAAAAARPRVARPAEAGAGAVSAAEDAGSDGEAEAAAAFAGEAARFVGEADFLAEEPFFADFTGAGADCSPCAESPDAFLADLLARGVAAETATEAPPGVAGNSFAGCLGLAAPERVARPGEDMDSCMRSRCTRSTTSLGSCARDELRLPARSTGNLGQAAARFASRSAAAGSDSTLLSTLSGEAALFAIFSFEAGFSTDSDSLLLEFSLPAKSALLSIAHFAKLLWHAHEKDTKPNRECRGENFDCLLDFLICVENLARLERLGWHA
jgi:hypothetical protein